MNNYTVELLELEKKPFLIEKFKDACLAFKLPMYKRTPFVDLPLDEISRNETGGITLRLIYAKANFEEIQKEINGN